MPSFGIISEGITDQIIVENVLIGIFNDFDLNTSIKFLQPLQDATDEAATQAYGGWENVFNYCKSSKLIESFEQNDFIIIQIDTDVCEEKNYGVSRVDKEGTPLSTKELVAAVIERINGIILSAFGEAIFTQINDRVLYAICVNEIECWLLPLFFDNNFKSATNNCIHKLNPKISESFDFFIDPKNKCNQSHNYNKISKKFLKRKILFTKYQDNESLKLFVDQFFNRGLVETP